MTDTKPVDSIEPSGIFSEGRQGGPVSTNSFPFEAIFEAIWKFFGGVLAIALWLALAAGILYGLVRFIKWAWI